MATADTGTWKPLGSRATTQRERDIDDIFQAYPECTRSNLSIDDLGYVLRVLHNVGVQSRWLQIGQTLQINDGSLQAIKGDPSYCLLKVIVLWLRGQTRLPDQPSWWRVVWAVANEHGGNELRSAKISIAKKYKEMEGLSKFIPMTTHAKETSRISLLNEGSGGVFEVSADAVDELYQDLTPAANRWMDIGVLLGVDYALLEQKRDEDKHQCLRETIKLWLDSLNDPTLQRLVEAVEHSAGGNYPAQAKLIMDKYRERTNSTEAGRPTSQIPAHDPPAPPKQVHAAEVPDGPPPHRQDSDQPAPPKQVHKIVRQESVPPRHSVYVERKGMTEKIRTELRRLKDIDGWVVVHGMAGFGKTVLAAEAVRDATLLQEVFPGGVFWLTVGQINDRSGELLSKIQRLIQKLDKEHYRPPNVEEASDHLQRVMSEQHPRALLILDDVWSEDVATVFGVGCRTMVTSRFEAIATNVQSPNFYSVSVSEGFSEEEGRLLLSQWLNVPSDSLSLHADMILRYCRGSPLAIALIGAKLRKDPRDAMWKMVAEKLEHGHVGAIQLGAKLNDWKYKHPTINASMELSVESLPDHLKKYFEVFVVFDYDIQISCKTLATIWGTSYSSAHDFLQELISYSLAQEGRHDSDYRFFIHDLILDFLKCTILPTKQEMLHQKVVQQYAEQCGGDFATISPDDSYVYRNLLSHIAAAGNSVLLGNLMTSLSWLIASIQHGDPNTVLDNYRTYKCKVAEQFRVGVQQFEFFVSSHMYVLTSNPRKEDIVQLALLLPDTSDIYCQAVSLALGDRKKSWFKWSNKESDPEKNVLKLKMHRDGIMQCQYSRDGTCVASCSQDADVKVWDSSTGMVLANFKGHKDLVTCCALSRSGKLVVSGSEDCTVKVWHARTHHKRVVTDFTQHRYGIQCCDFSPDEKLVLSADIDSCIMVWEAQTGEVKAKWHIGAFSPLPMDNMEYTLAFACVLSRSVSTMSQGGEGLMSCAFAPSGKSIATASQNGIIRLWTPLGGLLTTLHGHCGVVCSVMFSHDGSQLASACLSDCTAKIWAMDGGECLHTLEHATAVLSCAFSPDASRLITGDMEGYVKIWSVDSGRMLQDLLLHFDSVTCVLYSPSGQHILSAADNGLIKILWNEYEEEMEPAVTIQYHHRFSAWFKKTGTVYVPVILCYNIKEKNMQILQGSNADTVITRLPTVEQHTARSWQISSTGCMVAIGYTDGMLQMISITQSEEGVWRAAEAWRKEAAHDSPVLKVYFAPDDSKIISCSADQHKSWCATSGKELAVISGCGVGVRLCVFFNNSILVASAQRKGVLVWSSDTGIPKLPCLGMADNSEHSILCINLSQDNSRLVASTTTGLVSVWETEKGKLLMMSTLIPMIPCARSCALSSNGDLMAAGFDNGDLRIWNVSTGKEVAHRPTTSDYWMIDMAFSPCSQQIVTLCDSIEWWHASGEHSKTLLLKGAFGRYIRFSPDFQTFVTIDNAGLLYILTPLTSE